MKRSAKRQLKRAAKKRAGRKPRKWDPRTATKYDHKRVNPALPALLAGFESKPLSDAELIRMHREIAFSNLIRAIVEVMPHALTKFKVPAKPDDEDEGTIQ